MCSGVDSDSGCDTTPSSLPADDQPSQCSKNVGDGCTNDDECCNAKCGTDSICYKECQGVGDYCETDDDCCESGKCSGGLNPFCYKNLPEAVTAPPLATAVVSGKRVRIQLLSFSPFELFGLLIYDKTGNNIAEAGSTGVSINSDLTEGQAIDAITSNEESCILKQIGSWIEITLGSNADISAIEIYSKSMADGYDQAPAEVVISVGDDGSVPQKYTLLHTIAGSRSQTLYAAEFRDLCTSSTDCFDACKDEDCKKACGWHMGNGIYDPSLWCAMGTPDKEKLSLKICENQAAASVRNRDFTVIEDHRLLSNQCSQNEVPIEISSKWISLL